MTAPLPINIAVEDDLSEAVLRRVLRQTGRPYFVGRCFNGRGFGYLKRTIGGFNNAARVTPFLVLTDLDKRACAPALIAEWIDQPLHSNLLFRVAVRQVEAWLLADGSALARFLEIQERAIPANVDEIDDSKQCLVDLARKSRRRELKNDIVPPTYSVRKQGPNYNGRLAGFVARHWDAHRARERSPSLNSALHALESFTPSWSEN